MSSYIELNGGEFHHISMIKRLRLITDQERESLANLDRVTNADKFSTRVEFRDKTKSYAVETVDEIAAQGIALVEVDDGAFTPRDNIIRTKNITEKDRADFESNRGQPMREDFKSRIETKAGVLLATVDSKTVMQRMTYPYQPQTVDLQQHNQQAEKGYSISNDKTVLQQREKVLSQAPTKVKSIGPEHPRER